MNELLRGSAGSVSDTIWRGLSILFIAIMLIAIIGGHAQAQDGSQSKADLNTDVQEASSLKTEMPEAPEKPAAKILSGAINLQHGSNLVNRGKAGHESQTQLDLTLSARMSDFGKFSINQGIAKSYQGEEELDVTNTKLGIRHNRIPLHRDVGIANGIFAKLPANKKTREKDKLTVGAGIENLIDVRPGIGPISLSNRLVLSKNFHEYTVNAYGSPTIEWSLTEGLTTTAELGQVVSLSFDVSYLTSRTYHGTTKSRIDMTEEIGFQVSKAVGLAIGYTNGSDLVTSTQKSSSIEAFNDESATIYGSINVVF